MRTSVICKDDKRKLFELKICTVIGFPSDTVLKEVKVFETADAVKTERMKSIWLLTLGDVKTVSLIKITDEIAAVKKPLEIRYLR